MHIARHALNQIEAKCFDRAAVLDAAVNPGIRSVSHTHPGQFKHIANGLCVVLAGDTIVTVFKHLERTPLRPDQEVAA
jgi:hypothetical protein